MNCSRFVRCFDVEKKDIYLDKGLLIKYKLTIPVVQDEKSRRELYWPFDLSSFESWFYELQAELK